MSEEERDQSFNVPEPPTGMGSGFLTEYWQQEDPLPRIRGFRNVWYFIQQGFKTVAALPMSSGITIMTIATSLFLLAGFLLAVQNVGRLVVSAGSTFYVTVYVKEQAPQNEVNDFIRELEGNPRVRSVEYISKDQALEAFRKDLGARSAFLEGIEKDNPLPASIDVVLQPDDLGINAVSSMLERLRANTTVVDEVVYGNEWVERMQGVLRIFRLFGAVSMVIMLVVVISLIANTIKLVIYARRDEIGIMQLVGASEWFVKTPFIVGGLIQGGVGSVLGIIFLRMSFALLTSQIQNMTLFGSLFPQLTFLHWATISAIVLFGLLIGALGSFFSLGRFMNV
ncbi:MAG: permease-like cell division protein FtsX [Bdellovibrionota bacterium]